MALKLFCLAMVIIAPQLIQAYNFGYQQQKGGYTGYQPQKLESCPTGFHFLAEKCYRFHQTPVNWETAERRCEDEGSTLASVTTADEYTSLLEHINGLYSGQYWVSGSRVAGLWVWTNSGLAMKQEWFGQTPASSGPLACSYFCSTTLKYWDGNCGLSKKFICELAEDDDNIGNEIELR